ncbi:membrane protein of unknown function [Candidatus Hydrogenisulfobacillus filiaventi]|uniref:Uncharacterized protein n=1 Tax=Candidatus Hydrogenisulfobacillus filiaventi TaxID=2707344 RepID=A0A6F8ZHQ8_9FIRM|nr:membrane protein of unknown function [Candidatus Hydrogenisulfobacillus filiaventi]
MTVGEAWIRYRNVVRNPGVWWAAAWEALGSLLVLVVMGVVGAGAILGSTSAGHASPHAVVAAILGALPVMLVITAMIGPVFLAGFNGALADAVRGEPVDGMTFWREARAQYGRAWAAMLGSLLLMAALGMVMVLLIATLHAVGGVLAAVLALAWIPLPLRFLALLFVRRLGFASAMRMAMSPDGLGTFWWGSLQAVAVVLVIGMLVGVLGLIPVIGQLLGLAWGVAEVVLVQLWAMELVVDPPAVDPS